MDITQVVLDDHAEQRRLVATPEEIGPNAGRMAEAECGGLADFRRRVGLEERHALAVRFLAFESEHMIGLKPLDEDAESHVREQG